MYFLVKHANIKDTTEEEYFAKRQRAIKFLTDETCRKQLNLSHRLNIHNALKVFHKWIPGADFSKSVQRSVFCTSRIQVKLCSKAESAMALALLAAQISCLKLCRGVPHICCPDHKTCDSCKRVKEGQHGIQGWVHTRHALWWWRSG